MLALGALVYFGGRVVVEGSESRARANAERMMDLESALRIDIEDWLQARVVDIPVLEALGNWSYVWLHWPLLLAVLIYLFKTDRSIYARLRNSMFISGAIGLVLFAAFPEAPPRFLEGFVGTVSDDARRHYLPYPLSWTNRFAAFPSFHVGWTLVACVALQASLRRSWGPLVLVPAAMVSIAVVTTGNHFVLDAVAGTAIAVGAYFGLGRRRREPDR